MIKNSCLCLQSLFVLALEAGVTFLRYQLSTAGKIWLLWVMECSKVSSIVWDTSFIIQTIFDQQNINLRASFYVSGNIGREFKWLMLKLINSRHSVLFLALLNYSKNSHFVCGGVLCVLIPILKSKQLFCSSC